ERFESLAQLEQATLLYGLQSKEETTVRHKMRTVVVDQEGTPDLGLQINDNEVVKFSNSGFKQLSSQVGAPPSYLATLPHELAATNLNHGIMNNAGDTS